VDEKIISSVLSAEDAFRLALKEAAKGAPYVSPNPLVGCVIVDENQRLLATGYHAKYGEAHAEADALRKLKYEQLKNATVYVTLEPCAHEGKTPSCAKALAKLPIKKVVYGLQDPNPLVSGQGAEILRKAGIEAIEYQGPFKSQFEEICEVFLKNFRQKQVFVAAKVASSLDGQIALKSGESKWITGPESREKVHELRSWYDAVLIGRNTIEIDNPSLDIRHPQIKKENFLIVLDPQSYLLKKIKEGAKFRFLEARSKDKIIFAVHQKNTEFNYTQISFSSLDSLVQEIWKLGLKSVFIEGGAQTYSSFLKEGLIDRLHLFIAPSVIGSGNGLSWTNSFEISELSQKLIISSARSEKFGDDFYITGKISDQKLSSGPKV